VAEIVAYIQKRTNQDGKTNYRVQVRLRGYAPESATFERLTDAKQWAAQTESDMKSGRYFGQSKRHTFKELRIEYEKHAADLRSIDDRKRHLSRWGELFGDDLLSDITPSRINKARSELLSENTRLLGRATGDPELDGARKMGKRSAQTVNRYIASLSACLTFGVKPLEWLERNPCEKVTKAKENAGRVRFLSEDELKRLLDASRHHADLYLALVLSLTTGGRQSEIMGIRWLQVDFTRKTITLVETTNGDRRTLPLVGEAFTLLQERSKVRNLKEGRIFVPVKVEAEQRSLREAWERALEAAKIEDFRWHDLRHTAASYLVMSGVSLVEVAKILGHRTLTMVARYAHLADEHIVATGEKLAARLGC
jgi:integrase